MGCGDVPIQAGDPCHPGVPACCQTTPAPSVSPRFAHATEHALAYVRAAKARGAPIVGIMCEFAPREVIMAAGGVPVCLCGGSNATIAAAEERLPANLCPLIKSTFGYHLTRTNPFLELCDLIVAETTCDGKTKMYELMAETRPMHVLQLPRRDDAAGRELWRGEVRRLATELERRFGTAVTPVRLSAATVAMERDRAARRAVAARLAGDATPFTGRQLLDLRSLVAAIPEDVAELERLAASPPPGTCRRGQVRVLLSGVPVPHGAEKVVDLIEANGGLVVAQENCSGYKPLTVRLDPTAADLMSAVADAYLGLPCSVKSPNDTRLSLIRELAGLFRADCVVELVWQACLTYDIESARVRSLCGELGLPHLRIGTDFAPADAARIAVRLEALFESVQAAPARG